jgi:hypothetical protein
MPNWVYNTINVMGNPDDIAEFASHIATPPRMISDEERENFGGFSFHSFVTLPDEATLEEYHETSGWKDGERTGDTEYNWYNWNSKAWNTKWDACNPALVSGSNQITISFETAWSQPWPVFEAMVKQFPKLSFEIWWEEEQGFGEELQGVNGVLNSTKSWDIPQSHADYVDQDKLDSCACNNYSEQEYWYDDCPGKSNKRLFTVDTVTKRYIYAYTEEDAIEAAKAEEGGYGLPDHTEVKDTLYAEEFRVVDSDKVEEE